MDKIKIDRRVRKTKKVLTDALIQLMREKKANKITVKELTELADVNRSTFYLYYKDIFDMIDKVESEIIENFTYAFKEFSTKDATYENTLSFFTYVFEFVKDNSSICQILLGPDGEYSFIEKFKIAITQAQPSGKPSHKNRHEFFLPFVVSGSIGVIQNWLKDDMSPDASEMAGFIARIVFDTEKSI